MLLRIVNCSVYVPLFSAAIFEGDSLDRLNRLCAYFAWSRDTNFNRNPLTLLGCSAYLLRLNRWRGSFTAPLTAISYVEEHLRNHFNDQPFFISYNLFLLKLSITLFSSSLAELQF